MALSMHCKPCFLPHLTEAYSRDCRKVYLLRSPALKPKASQFPSLRRSFKRWHWQQQCGVAKHCLSAAISKKLANAFGETMPSSQAEYFAEFLSGKSMICTDFSLATMFRSFKPRVHRYAALRADLGSPREISDEFEHHTHDLADHFNQFSQMVARDDPDGAAKALKGMGHFPAMKEAMERVKDVDDFKEQLQDLYLKVERMIEEGDEETGRALIEANYEALMEQLDQGINGVEQAAMLDILAQLSMSLLDLEEAGQMLDQMKDILTNVEVHEPLVDIIFEHMGSMHLALGNKKEALSYYTRSLDIQENVLGEHSPLLIRTLLGLASAYSDLGRGAKSIEIYKRILLVIECSKGSDSDELAVPLLHLGHTLLEEDRMDEAEVYMYRALKLAEKTDGKGDGSVGVATCALARVKCAKGEYDQAAELFLEGLKTLKNSSYLSGHDPILESVRTEVAEFLNLMGRDDEAQELWEENLYETEKLVGASSPGLVVHLQNLATCYAHGGKFDKCEPLLRRSLQLVTTSLGPTAPQVSVPLEFLATTLHHLGREREAEPLARQALNIRENNFGMDDPIVGEACDLLASILHSLGRNHEALTLMWRVLHIKEAALGSDSLELCSTLELLIELLVSLGRTKETLPLIQRFERLLVKAKNASN